MNERIRALADEAGFNPYNYEGGNLALFEKFAELIVRECIVDFYRQYFDDSVDEDITVTVERYVEDLFNGEVRLDRIEAQLRQQAEKTVDF
jgi:hypothetical protein